MQAMVTQGRFIFLGCRGMVGRQQWTHEGMLGEEEIRRQARLQVPGLPLAQLGSKEQVRRQMIAFAYSRGLNPAHISEQVIQPLVEHDSGAPSGSPMPKVNPAPSPQTSHGHHSTIPMTYGEYRQQWKVVVVGNRRDGEGLVTSDGRERGNRPNKRCTVGN